jgi:hypothetical protein
MGLPGFTAEVSLYQTSGHYWLAAVATSNVGIHVVPAQRGSVLPFAGGGNGGGPPQTLVCVPNDSTDPPSDCPSGFALCSLDPTTGDCPPVGKCCKLGPPPPPTRAQCDQNYTACMVPCGFIPFPFNLPCVHNCNTALCDCLIVTGTFPPGTVLNCGI